MSKMKRVFVQPPFTLERILIVMVELGSPFLKRKQQLVSLTAAKDYWEHGLYADTDAKEIVGWVNGVQKTKSKMEEFFGGQVIELKDVKRVWIDGKRLPPDHTVTYETECRLGRGALGFYLKDDGVINYGAAPVIGDRHLQFDLLCLMDGSKDIVPLASVASKWPHNVDDWPPYSG